MNSGRGNPGGSAFVTVASKRRECAMPQMFDWIFFAITILPCVYLVWDWFKNR